MGINVGDKLPNLTLKQATTNGAVDVVTGDLFKNKTTVLFGLPGAFTPVCSSKHLPGFMALKDKLSQKGVNQIVCLSVNDPFVMNAWAEAQHVKDSVIMLADGNGDFTKAVGLEMDLTSFGMGIRSQRYVMVIKDGTLSHLDVEPASTCHLTSAEHVLDVL